MVSTGATWGSSAHGHRVEVRFHGSLGELVVSQRRGHTHPVEVRGHTHRVEVAPGTTVKDLIESLGVPHTEVDVIVVDGTSVGFGHQVADGETVGVYPMAGAVDVTPVLHLQPSPPGRPAFVVDVHLGRLARSLRLLGFDVLWRNDLTDSELAAISAGDRRILLTRDRQLLKRSQVATGYLVRSTERHVQLAEVLARYDLADRIAPFGRCLACNGLLEDVAKDVVAGRLPPRARRDYTEFRQCPDCGRIYWRGSHYDRLATVVEEVRRKARGTGPPTSAP